MFKEKYIKKIKRNHIYDCNNKLLNYYILILSDMIHRMIFRKFIL